MNLVQEVRIYNRYRGQFIKHLIRIAMFAHTNPKEYQNARKSVKLLDIDLELAGEKTIFAVSFITK